MNGVEQRQRHLAVARAERRIDDLGTLLIELGAEVVKDRAAATQAIQAERTHRLQLADEQRAYVDGEIRKLSWRLYAFETRTLWQRLRWIVRGV